MLSRAKEELRKKIEKNGGYLEKTEKETKGFIEQYRECLEAHNKYEIKTRNEIRCIIDQMNQEQPKEYYIKISGVVNSEFKKIDCERKDIFLYRAFYEKNYDIIKIIYNKEIEQDLSSFFFRILHEIAHLYLGHKLDEGYGRIDKSISKKKEYEASYFASALLLNKKKFQMALKNNRYNLEIISKTYHSIKVSYETVAHRCASLSNGKIHFLKTDKKNHISKQFMLPISKNKIKDVICDRWCAVKAFKEKKGKYTQKTILKNFKDGKDVIYYCYSKLIKKYDKEYTITIGCKEDFKENMSQFDDNRNIEKETFHCFAKEKKCNEECIN